MYVCMYACFCLLCNIAPEVLVYEAQLEGDTAKRVANQSNTVKMKSYDVAAPLCFSVDSYRCYLIVFIYNLAVVSYPIRTYIHAHIHTCIHMQACIHILIHTSDLHS